MKDNLDDWKAGVGQLLQSGWYLGLVRGYLPNGNPWCFQVIIGDVKTNRRLTPMFSTVQKAIDFVIYAQGRGTDMSRYYLTPMKPHAGELVEDEIDIDPALLFAHDEIIDLR